VNLSEVPDSAEVSTIPSTAPTAESNSAPPGDGVPEVKIQARHEDPAMQDVAIADTTHIEVNFDGDVCGYKPLTKKGAFTVGGQGCADIFNREASAGISVTYAPKNGIAGPILSATVEADAAYQLGGDRSKIITATVEVATPIPGLHLDVGAKTHGHGVGAYIGISKPL
jgi:hypothetical protein